MVESDLPSNASMLVNVHGNGSCFSPVNMNLTLQLNGDNLQGSIYLIVLG